LREHLRWAPADLYGECCGSRDSGGRRLTHVQPREGLIVFGAADLSSAEAIVRNDPFVEEGFVALMLGLRPDLGPSEIKQMLIDTSRRTTFEGRTSPRTLDIGAALRKAASER
jgi:hypothetical protein